MSYPEKIELAIESEGEDFYNVIFKIYFKDVDHAIKYYNYANYLVKPLFNEFNIDIDGKVVKISFKAFKDCAITFLAGFFLRLSPIVQIPLKDIIDNLALHIISTMLKTEKRINMEEINKALSIPNDVY